MPNVKTGDNHSEDNEAFPVVSKTEVFTSPRWGSLTQSSRLHELSLPSITIGCSSSAPEMVNTEPLSILHRASSQSSWRDHRASPPSRLEVRQHSKSKRSTIFAWRHSSAKDQLEWMHLNSLNECKSELESRMNAQGSQGSMNDKWAVQPPPWAVGEVFIASTNKSNRWEKFPTKSAKSGSSAVQLAVHPLFDQSTVTAISSALNALKWPLRGERFIRQRRAGSSALGVFRTEQNMLSGNIHPPYTNRNIRIAVHPIHNPDRPLHNRGNARQKHVFWFYSTAI